MNFVIDFNRIAKLQLLDLLTDDNDAGIDFSLLFWSYICLQKSESGKKYLSMTEF